MTSSHSVGAGPAAEGWASRVRHPLARSSPGAAGVVGVAAAVAIMSAVLGVTPVRVAGVAAVAAIVAGVLLHRRVRDRGALDPLLVIGAGLAVLTFTQGGLTDLHGATWASASVLFAYPLLARGLMRLFIARLPGRDSDVLVQAGLAALAAGVALAVLTSGAGHSAPHQLLLPVIVTALDVGLLAIVARLMMLPGPPVTAYRYLALAVAYLLGAHASLVMTLAWGAHGRGWVLSLLGVGAFAMLGVAALQPSVTLLEDPVDGDVPSFSPGHLVLVVGAVMLGPAAVALHVARHEPVSRPTAVGATLVALMLAAYMSSLLWERAAAEHKVQHDELTGLPNRILLLDRTSRALAHARRSGSPVAVMFIDLDRFKWVNDTFGHGIGDTLLRVVGQRLTSTLRDEDTVARLGGDEFVILLPNVSGPDAVVTVAERVRALFKDPIDVDGRPVPVTASVGVAVYPYDGDQPEQLIDHADAAMYRAKEAGRNTFEIYSPQLKSRAQERLALEAALLTAMAQGELVLYYQPIFDVATAHVVGAEALIRWQHPERGLILPGGFVPIAEQSDLVVTLGTAVLGAACRQLALWTQPGLPALSVSVNVSARQLRHGIADLVAATLRTTSVDPARLVLELTETAAVDDVDRVATALSEVKRMGVRWAIDDFGTGYCSLMYLSRLPVDSLKIDKSFVQSSAPADESIVAAIIAMGHGLGLSVVGEGVERIEQLESLAARGCDQVQGFLFGRPLPPAEFEQFVRRQFAASPAAARAALSVR